MSLVYLVLGLVALERLGGAGIGGAQYAKIAGSRCD